MPEGGLPRNFTFKIIAVFSSILLARPQAGVRGNTL